MLGPIQDKIVERFEPKAATHYHVDVVFETRAAGDLVSMP